MYTDMRVELLIAFTLVAIEGLVIFMCFSNITALPIVHIQKE